jgi:hypothetical protein
MRKAVGYLAAGALLILAGASLCAVGYVERRAAKVREQMFTLQHDAVATERGRIDDWVRSARRLPWVGPMGVERAEQRAASQYWLRKYESLGVKADGGRTPSDVDPHVLMTAAHAAYRQTMLDGSDPETVKRLDRVITLYVEVLKRDPRDFDAAYNFEFVARRRNAIAAMRLAQARARGKNRVPQDERMRVQAVPRAGKTLHGERGAIPPGLEREDFKVIVPAPTDEREEQREAGSGTPRVRKG